MPILTLDTLCDDNSNIICHGEFILCCLQSYLWEYWRLPIIIIDLTRLLSFGVSFSLPFFLGMIVSTLDDWLLLAIGYYYRRFSCFLRYNGIQCRYSCRPIKMLLEGDKLIHHNIKCHKYTRYHLFNYCNARCYYTLLAALYTVVESCLSAPLDLNKNSSL